MDSPAPRFANGRRGRMKVAIVTYRYPPQPGGVAASMGNLAKGLADLGHEVVVYSTRLPGGSSEEAPGRIRVNRTINITGVQLMYGVLPNVFGLVRSLSEDKPDVMILNGVGHFESVLASEYARFIPQIMVAHGSATMYYRPDRPWYHHAAWKVFIETFGKHMLKRVDTIIALALYELPNWEHLGVPLKKVRVIPWGVTDDCFQDINPEDFKMRHGVGGRMILFAGNLVPQKGPQLIIRALAGLVSTYPDVKAIFVGPSTPFKRELVALSEALSLSENVMFLGYVSRIELLRAYAACDIFVHPSDYEAFGLAIVEAMAFGKPIVACNVGAVPSLVERNACGILVPQRDVVKLRQAIRRLLDDPELRDKLGSNARSAARHYSWPVVSRAYESLCEDLVADYLSRP